MKDNDNDDANGNENDDVYQESFERASADLEMLRAAYPDEITFEGGNGDGDGDGEEGEEAAQPNWFPLIFTFSLGHMMSTHNCSQQDETRRFGATITMEFPKGKMNMSGRYSILTTVLYSNVILID